jgi:presequence protease
LLCVNFAIRLRLAIYWFISAIYLMISTVGSLQTFLNAFTYPDRTCYPVASMNTKDFYNLIHVYIDAVLHPRAINDPLVLQQEGWHYELEDASQPLVYKGVVYNEMKGST